LISNWSYITSLHLLFFLKYTHKIVADTSSTCPQPSAGNGASTLCIPTSQISTLLSPSLSLWAEKLKLALLTQVWRLNYRNPIVFYFTLCCLKTWMREGLFLFVWFLRKYGKKEKFSTFFPLKTLFSFTEIPACVLLFHSFPCLKGLEFFLFLDQFCCLAMMVCLF
jgi:hypothetical protein